MAGEFSEKLGRLYVTIDSGKLREVEEEIAGYPAKVDDVVSGAINKILPKLRTRLVRTFTQKVNLPRHIIRNRMSIHKASKASLTGWVKINNKKIELWLYGAKGGAPKRGQLKELKGGAKQTSKGVEVKIYRSGPTKEYPHYFINRGTKTRRLAVFKRTGKSRYPIHTQYGPSILQLYSENPQMITDELEVTNEELNTQLDSQVDRILKRRKIDR